MAEPVDPTLHTAALAALEAALKRALDLSQHSKSALAQLEAVCLPCIAQHQAWIFTSTRARRVYA